MRVCQCVNTVIVRRYVRDRDIPESYRTEEVKGGTEGGKRPESDGNTVFAEKKKSNCIICNIQYELMCAKRCHA